VVYTHTIVKEKSGKTIYQLITALGPIPANYCILAEASWNQRAFSRVLVPTLVVHFAGWDSSASQCRPKQARSWALKLLLKQRGVWLLVTLQDHSMREDFIRNLCQRNN